jgi:4-hydroxy-tetrahydrodipicolinate synthase
VTEAHDLFDAHLPLIRYERQPGVGLAVRKYVMRRRDILASDAQRKPGRGLTDTERAEADLLQKSGGRGEHERMKTWYSYPSRKGNFVFTT